MGRELRAEARIAVSQKGALNSGSPNSGETWFPCLLVDASESGFAMLCVRPLAVEEILDFRCELHPNTIFECKVEIRYVSEDRLGVMITDIDEQARELWKSYLRDQLFARRPRAY